MSNADPETTPANDDGEPPANTISLTERLGVLSAEDRASMFIEWCALHKFPARDRWPDGAYEQLVGHIRQSEFPFLLKDTP
jgi:hypothetical protein